MRGCLAICLSVLPALAWSAEPVAQTLPAGVCPLGASVAGTVFNETFDSGFTGWTATHAAGSSDWQRILPYGAPGTYAMYGPNPSTISDLRATMSSAVYIPRDAYLWFENNFGFDFYGSNFYDGGVLEYSTDNGASWIDAGPLFSEGKNYGGVISSSGNPLAGRSAFVGDSGGVVPTRYNLTGLVDQTVRFRWRIGSDAQTGGYGWFVDNIKISLCPTAASFRFFDLSPATVTCPAGVACSRRFLLGGMGFTAVDRIDFAWVGDLTGSMSWYKNDVNWNAGVSNLYTTSMVIQPSVVAPATRATPSNQYTVTLHTTSGQTGSKTFSVLAGDPITTGRRFDFDGDSRSDILWRHALTGEVLMWKMNGTALGSAASVNVVDSNWRIVGSGDFNGDGKADIVWRHATTGEVYVWLMNGTTIASHGSLGVVSDLQWKVITVGDFNGDGRADIAWRHALTGEVYIWLMNGAAIASRGSVYVVADSNWLLAGSGDFDGDGKADLLWRHEITGELFMWKMNGLSIGSPVSVGMVSDLNWRVAGTGDYDGNGKADILFRHQISGQVFLWRMNGATIATAVPVYTVADSNWQIVGATSDYNGDGKTDLLWRHATTGEIIAWQMIGATIASSATVYVVTDKNWIMQNLP